MAKLSFVQLKQELDDACDYLRCFTLARDGFTEKKGVEGIQRLSDLCDKMSKSFAKGSYASKAVALVAMARTRIKAADARLNLLRKTRAAAKAGHE